MGRVLVIGGISIITFNRYLTCHNFETLLNGVNQDPLFLDIENCWRHQDRISETPEAPLIADLIQTFQNKCLVLKLVVHGSEWKFIFQIGG